MAYRLIEIILPSSLCEKAELVLDNFSVIGMWKDRLSDKQSLVRISAVSTC